MRADEEREFREFVAARSQSLLHTAYLLTGDWEQGRDLLQGALAATAARWSKLQDRQQPEAYVRRALYHAQVDRTRRLSWRKETVTAELPEHSLPGSDCADVIAARQDIVAALRQLPKGQRAVVVLRYLEDRSDAEIADLLGITVGTVRSQAHRALIALRVVFDEQDQPANGAAV